MNKMKPNILFSLLIAGWIPAAGLSAQTYDFTFAPNKADKGSTTIYITPIHYIQEKDTSAMTSFLPLMENRTSHSSSRLTYPMVIIASPSP